MRDIYFDKIINLRTGGTKQHSKPHKPIMLLSILDLIESGTIESNRIEYTPELIESFRRYFDIVKEKDDAFNPYLPFWHLRGDKILHHRAKEGMEKALNHISSPTGPNKMREFIEYAYMDEELFSKLQKQGFRDEIRSIIVNNYFSKFREALEKAIREEKYTNSYGKALLKKAEGSGEDLPEVNEHARKAAFSRTVKRIYNYRCAACGLRVIFEDIMIVDAAHLIPFRVNHDDDPRNGIALCKNHHWAMDRYLIAPDLDMNWKASGQLDDRIEGQQKLLDLQNRKILLPDDEKYYPKEESLRWRIERLK